MNEFSSLGLDCRTPSANKPHQISICCPFCVKRGKTPDTKFHLGIDLKRKIYNCYRCGAKASEGDTGSLNNLLLLTNLMQPVPTDVSKIRERINKIGTRESINGVLDLDLFSWPIDKEQTPFAYNYMLTVRKFTPEQIERCKMRVGKEYFDKTKNYKIRKWTGRVIFPFYEDGKPIYAVGRTYVGKDPKYLNSDGNKGSAVYGIDNITSTGTAILCEGIISAIAAETTTGMPAVAILGKMPTDIQLMKLKSKCHTVYKSLDGGLTGEENYKVRKKLIQHGFTVYEISLPGESDPDDLGEDYQQYYDERKKVSLF